MSFGQGDLKLEIKDQNTGIPSAITQITHPLFKSAVENQLVNLDQKEVCHYHLPQRINATPDGILPVNGFSWKVPDEEVMQRTMVRNVLQLLISEKSGVDFIALQNYVYQQEDLNDIRGTWGVYYDRSKQLAVLYRGSRLKPFSTSGTNDEDNLTDYLKSPSIINQPILAFPLCDKATRRKLVLASIDKININTVKRISIFGCALVLAGDFNAPFDIAKDHPTVLEYNPSAAQPILYHQTDGALLFCNTVQDSEPLPIVLDTQSWGIKCIEEKAGERVIKKIALAPEFRQRSVPAQYLSPITILEHRWVELETKNNSEEKMSYPLPANVLQTRVEGAISGALEQNTVQVAFARDGIGQRYVRLTLPQAPEEGEGATALIAAIQRLRPAPIKLEIRGQENRIFVFNLSETEHQRFLDDLPTIHAPFEPKCPTVIPARSTAYRALVMLEWMIACGTCGAILVLSWASVIKQLSNNSRYEEHITPPIVPLALLGLLCFITSYLDVPTPRQTPVSTLQGIGHCCILLGLLAMMVWGAAYGLDDGDSAGYAMANAVLADIVVIVTLLAVSATLVGAVYYAGQKLKEPACNAISRASFCCSAYGCLMCCSQLMDCFAAKTARDDGQYKQPSLRTA